MSKESPIAASQSDATATSTVAVDSLNGTSASANSTSSDNAKVQSQSPSAAATTKSKPQSPVKSPAKSPVDVDVDSTLEKPTTSSPIKTEPKSSSNDANADNVDGKVKSESSSTSSSSSPSINTKNFWTRISSLFASWSASGRIWGETAAVTAGDSKSSTSQQTAQSAVSSILFISTTSNDEDEYSKLLALQFYLFGYEVPDCAVLLIKAKSSSNASSISSSSLSSDKHQIIILTSTKKAAILEPLSHATEKPDNFTIQFLPFNKTDKNSANIDKIVEMIESSNSSSSSSSSSNAQCRLGVVYDKNQSIDSLDTSSRSLYPLIWSKLTSSTSPVSHRISTFDISSAVSTLLSIKDSSGKSATEKASELTTLVLKKFLLPEIEEAIDSEKLIQQTDLADRCEEIIREPSRVNLSKLKSSDVDYCYAPIIQSGASNSPYDLKLSAMTLHEPLSYSPCTSIVVQLGAKYKNFCSSIGRTYLINPSDDQKEVYNILSQIYVNCKSCLKVGNKLSHVYTTAKRIIQQSKRPELISKFTRNCGFATGLEFRDAQFTMNEKSNKIFAKNQIYNFTIGFSDLTTPVKRDHVDQGESETYDKHYALLISDTMLITDDEPESLTKMPREYANIAYVIGDQNDDATSKSKSSTNGAAVDGDETGNRSTRARKNDTSADSALEAEAERSAHQAELVRRQRELALQRVARQKGATGFNSNSNAISDEISSYDSFNAFPRNAKRDRIFVDMPAESVLLPIAEQLVPFHITRIKSVKKQEEGNFIYLRINFHTPDNKTLTSFTDPHMKFVSELTYRTQSSSLERVFFDMTELQKRVKNRLKEAEAKASLVIQEELRVDKSGILPTLKDVYVKPAFTGRKKTQGTIQAHLNGFRYITNDRMKVDIIYSNIKSAFYAPAEDTHQVLLHFELRNPILLDPSKNNKKIVKTSFLQFFIEVVEASEDLAMTSRYRDEDGLAEEQEERQRRKRWNAKFLNFVKETEVRLESSKLQAAKDLEFDIPYRELAFTGVPAKSSLQIMPTVNSLVALDDIPPLVLTLSEVEIAVFERIQFGLQNFDLVFVFKDLTRTPLRIDSIPVKSLESIKSWLNSCDLIFYETAQNILWKPVIKTITDDLAGFWEDGGWGVFLGDDDEGDGALGGEGEEGGGQVEDSASDFAPSDSSNSDESEEYETADEESTGDSDDDSSSGDADDSLSESGQDWSDMEEEAKRKDKDKARRREEGDIDSDDERRRKKKSKR